MNRLTDMDINVAVRRVLVRHWIDLGRLTIRATRGVVWINGSLVRVKNGGGELTNEAMLGILQEIKILDGVRRMHTRLLNFDGNVDCAPRRESVTQRGPVNTYEAKMTNVTLRELMEAIDGKKKANEPTESDKPAVSKN